MSQTYQWLCQAPYGIEDGLIFQSNDGVEAASRAGVCNLRLWSHVWLFYPSIEALRLKKNDILKVTYFWTTSHFKKKKNKSNFIPLISRTVEAQYLSLCKAPDYIPIILQQFVKRCSFLVNRGRTRQMPQRYVSRKINWRSVNTTRIHT